MSRIGNLPILIPETVKVEKVQDDLLMIKGSFGQISHFYPKDKIQITINDSTIQIKIINPEKNSKSLQGLHRSLINNAVLGVNQKFEKILEINGVGYRAQVKGKELILNLGYSHPINFLIPEGIEIKIEGNNISITGNSKEKVGLLAANIRSKRPPEPYKGKGIKYKDEHIIRKIGKSGK